MPSNNNIRDSILKLLLNFPNHESTIGKIALELKLDYNDCVVFCDDIIEKQLADATKISSPGEQVKKNKILILSPRGISFIRKGGFRNEAKLKALKTIGTLGIPIVALLISGVTLYSTVQDRNIQNERWKILNDPQMTISDIRMLPWLSFSELDFKSYPWGYNTQYIINPQNNRWSTLEYLDALDTLNKPINISKFFTIESLTNWLKIINYKGSYHLAKVCTASFAFENVGKTIAKDFSLKGYIKIHLNDHWQSVLLESSYWQTIIPQNLAQIFVPIPYSLNDAVPDTVYFKIITEYKNISGTTNKDTVFSRYLFSDNVFHNMQKENGQ